VPSQVLSVSYRARVSDERPVAQAALTLRVKARVSLNAPRAARNGQELFFSGRVWGRPLPKSGKLVELQALQSWGWETFATVKTDQHGRFHRRRRLHRSPLRAMYRFRARARQEAAYPYETGTSHVVRVRIN
jgi:hypothetical protein